MRNSYMSPEQFRGEAVPGSDLYALGGTILFLLSGGRHPSDFQAARYVVHVDFVNCMRDCRDEGWGRGVDTSFVACPASLPLRYDSPLKTTCPSFSYTRHKTDADINFGRGLFVYNVL